MGVQLTKELVRVDQVIGEDRTQSVVEGTITLPNGKPDIQQVISVDATLDPESIETDIIENKVIVEGKIDVNAMYVAALTGQPVHFVESSVDFSFFVKIPGAKKNMDVRVKAKIEHVHFSFDPERPREFKVRIIVEFFVKVTKRVEIEIVVDATGPADLQVLKKSIRIDDVVGEAKAQAIVKSDITVPSGKPDILEVIKLEGKARVNEVKIIHDKIIIEGVLEVSVLYAADVTDAPLQPVHFMEVDVPFTQFVEIPGAREGMSKLIKVEVEHIKGRRKDATTITVEAILKIRAKVFETKIIHVVVDVFSPSEELKVEKTLLKVDQVIGEAENEIVVKDTLTVPPEKPPIEQIYQTKAKARNIKSSIIDDKVIVEGTLFIETLYVADVTQVPGAPLQPLHFVEHEVPFTTFVEIPGAKEDMTLDFDVDVEHVAAKVDPNDPRSFEIRVVLRLRAKVTKMVQIEVVTNVIEFEEEKEEKEEKKEKKKMKEEEMPSMTIYIVQKGDTLWNIAKRYHVTLDSIIQANNIANPDSIMPGQQLVIPRRMM